MTIVDDFLVSIALTEDTEKIFKKFLKKAKTHEEKAEITTLYKRMLTKESGREQPTSAPTRAQRATASEQKHPRPNRPDIEPGTKLFSDPKNFNINEFNNFFDNLKSQQQQKPIDYHEMKPLQFGSSFESFQPITEYGGIIVYDNPPEPTRPHGMYQIQSNTSFEDFKKKKQEQVYNPNGFKVPEADRTTDSYYMKKKSKIEQELQQKRQKIIEKLKNNYYGEASQTLLRDAERYDASTLSDDLTYGFFKN